MLKGSHATERQTGQGQGHRHSIGEQMCHDVNCSGLTNLHSLGGAVLYHHSIDLRRVAMILGFLPLAGTVMAQSTQLLHRYSFTTDASDSAGGANGTLVGGATIQNGQVQLDGSSGYVNLPSGIV